MKIVQPRLKEWLKANMERTGWGVRQIGERGGIAHSTVGRALQPEEHIGYSAIMGLSRAFRYPAVNLLEMAELLPAKPKETQEQRQLARIYQDLDETKRRELIRYARYLRGD